MTELATNIAIGHRLRVARIVLNVDEREAAEACGVSLRTFRRFETGRLTRSGPIIRFTRKYGVSGLWLFDGEGGWIHPGSSKDAKSRVADAKSKVAILPAPLSPQMHAFLASWA
jgi:hypothetical protein